MRFYFELESGSSIDVDYKDKEELQNLVDQAKAVLGFEPRHSCRCSGSEASDGSGINAKPSCANLPIPEVIDHKYLGVDKETSMTKAMDTNIVHKREPKSVRLFLGVCCETEQYKVRNTFDEKAHCRVCNDKFDIKDLVITESVCPNCDNRAVFMTSKATTQHHCKACESPIDLVYVEKVNKIMSANLVK